MLTACQLDPRPGQLPAPAPLFQLAKQAHPLPLGAGAGSRGTAFQLFVSPPALQSRHNHFRSELGQEPVKLRRCGGCRERRYCSPE